MDFSTINYLKSGNTKQRLAYEVLSRYQVMEKLQAFDPLLVGTIPIGVDTEQSDLDIIGYYQDKAAFITTIKKLYSTFAGFQCWENQEYQAVVASFQLEDFSIELFGQNIPTRQQPGYRHMLVEYRLLQEYGEDFRQQIIQLKQQGVKTEPAFAQVLGLSGNPYEVLLLLE